MNTLQKIKNLVFGETAEVKLGEVSLEDGTVLSLSTDLPEVGSKVMIGEEIAPAGEYLLADGATITIDESGVISAMDGVAEPEAEEAPVDAAVELEDVPAEEVAEVVIETAEVVADVIDAMTPEDVTPEDAVVIAEEIVTLITEEVAKVEEAMNSKFEDFKTLMIELAEAQVKAEGEFEAFKKSPSGKTISETEFTVEEQKSNVMQTRIEKIKSLRNKN